MRQKSISPAERGDCDALVMQHLSLEQAPTIETIEQLLVHLEAKELLTTEQIAVIDSAQILSLFSTDIGQKMLTAKRVQREVPFSMAVSAKELYGNERLDSDMILIQGIIDCMIEVDQGIILLDYKTDGIYDRYKEGFEEAKSILEKRYRTQIDLYEQAITQIIEKEVIGKYLYFLMVVIY